ncbi:MAG: hypothetical protein AAFW84_26125 [Cyanobacteria bacterium J06635_15]
MTQAAARFKHQIEMYFKDSYEINSEIETAWEALKVESTDPATDMDALAEWACNELKKRVMLAVLASPQAEAKPLDE